MRGLKIHHKILRELSAHVDLKEVAKGYFHRRMITAPSCWTMREAVHLLGPISHNSLVVDCGYGTGAWLSELWARGFRNIVGVEPHLILPACTVEDIILRQIEFKPVRSRLQDVFVTEGAQLVTYFDSLSGCGSPLSEALPKIASMVADGGLAVFDYYMGEKFPGRYRETPHNVFKACSELGMSEVLFMRRRFQGRDIGLYGVRKCTQ